MKNRTPEVGISEVNDNNINNTDFNDIDVSNTDSINQSYMCFPARLTLQKELIEEQKKYKELIRENISFDTLKYQFSECRIEGIMEIMLDAVCSKKQILAVGSEELPQPIVKDRLLKLNDMHIQYVFETLDRCVSKIQNIKAYMLTALYNAPVTSVNVLRKKKVEGNCFIGFCIIHICLIHSLKR